MPETKQVILHANSQFRTQPSFTLSPLRKRNVAWRASLCVCWTGGSGLHECNTQTVLSIKVSIKFIYFYFKDYTSKYLKKKKSLTLNSDTIPTILLVYVPCTQVVIKSVLTAAAAEMAS